HLVRLRQPGVAHLLAAPATPSYRFTIPPPRRPAQLPPPHRVPVVGPGAVGAQNAGPSLTQPLTSHLPTASQAHHTHGHQARHRHPSPRPFVALPPAGLVEGGHLWRCNASAGGLSGGGSPLCRG